MMKLLILIIILYYTNCNTDDKIYSIKELRSNPMGISQKEDFFRVNLGTPANSRIVSYADFNNDKYVDLIVVSENEKNSESILFYYYNYELGIFEKDDFYSNFFSPFINKKIVNMVATDINSDKEFDLIITFKQDDKFITEFYIFNTYMQKFDISDFVITNSGIIIGDFNGDSLIDILFFEGTQRKFIYFEKGSKYIVKNFSEIISISGRCTLSENYLTEPIPVPHSAAFIDIDADCQNDIIIHSKDNLEIWRGGVEDDKIKYCLSKNSVYPVDKKLGHFAVADIDRNGMLDIVFPIKETSKIMIAYNKIKLEYDWSVDYCQTHKNLNFTIVQDVFDDLLINLNSEATQTLNIGNDKEKFHFEEYTHSLIRIGDINSDSYPDIILVMEQDGIYTTKVFLNTEINYGDKYDGPIRRTFNQNNTYILPINNSYYASFMDLDENGQLDILIVTKNNSLIGYFNNYNYDVFFLKSVTLRVKNKFTTNEIGTNYRYISTNLNGNRRMDVSFQSAQTSDLSLNLPYTYMGIGRSNNYIENFQVISTSRIPNEDNYKTFTPIIPNSQLIISRQLSEEKYSSWELDLIVTPTSKLSLLILTIVVLLVIILAIIIYLHIKEVKEDQETEGKNFIAWYS